MKRKARRINPTNKPKPSIQRGFGFEMPPERQLVDIYFDQKGMAAQAPLFLGYYQNANWRSPKGTPYRNWKTLATDWIFDYQQQLKFEQRIRVSHSIFTHF